ncbi:hypothetical protein GW17_00046479 [Ensete ventricosum]|nr:hypothetical protein GW17_00046479 [Ensete ventricosum]
MRRCCASLAVAFAHGRALLPWGGGPCWLAAPPRAATWSAGPPTSTVFTSGRRYGWVLRCRSSLMREPCYKRPPLQAGAASGYPCGGREENRSGRLKL